MRTTSKWLVLAVVASTSLAVFTLSSAQAAHAPRTSPMKGVKVGPAATASTPKKLLKTVFASGDPGTSAPAATFTAIDSPVTLACPSTAATCGYEVEQHVQVEGSSDGNLWAICTTLDGNFLSSPGCPYLGAMANGTFDSASFTQTAAGVHRGSHQLQTFLYATNGATIDNFEITYRLYQPA